MKKLFQLFLALILSSPLAAQVSGTVTIKGAVSQQQLAKSLDSIKIAILKEIGKPVEPTKDPCGRNPTIGQIRTLSATSMTVLYDAEGVHLLGFVIKDASGLRVAGGQVEPKNNTPNFIYEKLPAGIYRLSIFALDCGTGEPSPEVTFEIKGDSGTIPVDPDPKPEEPGTGVLKMVTTGLKENMQLQVSGSPENYTLNDLTDFNAANGYVFIYIVNGDIFYSTTPMRNYRYQSASPLRVVKAQMKKEYVGKGGFAHWTDSEQVEKENSFYDRKAGKELSENVSFAFETRVVAGKQNTGFLNYIPQNYDPSIGFTQWADIAPDMKMPSGHIFIARKGAWTIEQVMRKGQTHISNYNLPWNEDLNEVARLKELGITYNDVPRTEAFMNINPSGPDVWTGAGYNLKYWPNGPLSKEEAIRKADEADIGHAIWIGESMEGLSFMPQNQEMWGHFYKRLAERYQGKWGTKGIKWLIAHNYFQLWGGDANIKFRLGDTQNREKEKQFLALPISQFPSSVFTPGGTLSSTNLYVESVYLNEPDLQTGSVYQAIYRMIAFRKMGYEAGVFLAGVHEYRPNNKQLYIYPDGDFYSDTKLPLDPNVHIAYGFISQVYGSLFVEWGAGGKQLHKNFSREWADGLWLPKGSTRYQSGKKSPHLVDGNDYYSGYAGNEDYSYFSQKLWNDSYGQVDGGNDRYLRFRIDGGAWYEPENTNANDIINSYYDKRGFVHSRSKNGKVAWFYLNSFADNLKHELQVQLPSGEIVTKFVSSNAIHATIQ